MKEKKKMSLAMQIFIALVLAIAAGLLMQNHATFANTYIKPFGSVPTDDALENANMIAGNIPLKNCNGLNPPIVLTAIE